MTSLPVVERELRAAARRRATYRARTAIALGAMVLGLVAFFVCVFDSTLKFGTVFFVMLSSGMMGYCIAAGRQFTADCLSEEKREGTLGLLFLTDLKGYDVVLGKMAATSINGFYGLLAVMPVLALPLLTGGITSGEFWRVALALINAFLFSLAVGIFVSSTVREFRAAMAGNFYLLLVLMAGLPAIAGALAFFRPGWPVIDPLFYPCPIYSLVTAFESNYKMEHVNFWRSMGVIHGLTWLLVGLACWLAPRRWQETGDARRPATFGGRESTSVREAGFRKRLLDVNAYFWRAGKPRMKSAYVWGFMGAVVFWFVTLVISVGMDSVVKVDELVALVVTLVVNGTFKMWITLEATHALAEDQKVGAFELILSTPLTERDIIRGQLLALQRQFLKPLMAAVALELIFMVSLLLHPPGGAYVFFLWMAGILMLVADVVTLSVVGMASGLAAKNHTHAIVLTVRRVILTPWVLFGLVAAPAWIWSNLASPWGWWHQWKFHLGAWFGIGIAVDAYYTLRVWRDLTVHFRETALRRFAPREEQPGWWSRLLAKAKAGKSTTVGRRWKLALGTAVFLLAGMLFAAFHHWGSPPKSVEVTLGRSDGKLVAAAATRRGAYFVLPDGSLWRWGVTGNMPFAPMPEQVGTNTDWSDLVTYGDLRVGLKRDGTLWRWRNDEKAVQEGSSHDWAAVSLGNGFTMALKRDGTLWSWGRNDFAQLGNGPGPNLTTPAQVGTNHDWKSVECSGWFTFALQTNGSLWGMGTLFGQSPSKEGLPHMIPTPNGGRWINLKRIFGGEILAESDKREVCRIENRPLENIVIGTNSPPVEPVNTRKPLLLPWLAIYSIQTNGTLWQMQMKRTSPGTMGIGAPEPVDTMTNWVWVGEADMAAFGLTADGTLWTWGIDFGQNPVPSAKTKLEELLALASRAMSRGVASRSGLVSVWSGPQTTVPVPPRPLMKLKQPAK